MKKKTYLIPKVKMLSADLADLMSISLTVDGENSGIVDTGEEGDGSDMAVKKYNVWDE